MLFRSAALSYCLEIGTPKDVWQIFRRHLENMPSDSLKVISKPVGLVLLPLGIVGQENRLELAHGSWMLP